MKIVNDPQFAEKALLTRIALNINKELLPYGVAAITITITGMNESFSSDIIKTAVAESRLPFFNLELPESTTLVLHVFAHKPSLADFLKK